MRLPRRLALAGVVISVHALAGSLSAAADTPDTSIEMTVVTSTGEPVVGVLVRATDETQPGAPSRGCGTDEITPTDTAGHCTFTNLTVGYLYGIWLQGYAITTSGDNLRPAGYQPIILKVTGPQVAPPLAHAGNSLAMSGPVLPSSAEFVPAIGVCVAAGRLNAGVMCVTSDLIGNYYLPGGCCDVRLTGYLAGTGPYVNGSVSHAPTGRPAKIVVEVGVAPIVATPTPTPTLLPSTSPTATPTARPVTPGRPQNGGSLVLALLPALVVVVLGGAVILARRR
jgi:hypothetical protein